MKTTHLIRFGTLVLTGLLFLSNSQSAFAKRLKYSELQIKDYDEMQTLVNNQVRQAKEYAQAEDDTSAVESIREALVLVLSRPNQDNMLSKLMPDVRKELVNHNSFEDTLSGVINEALRSFEDGGDSKLPVVYRSTYLILLENFISEFKPEVSENKEIRKMFERIRDARIKVSKAVQKDLKMRSMLRTPSPSDLAKKVLESSKIESSKK